MEKAAQEPPCSDLPSLSTELTGVLAHVLQSLNDRLQLLEESLVDERAAKAAAEAALSTSAEKLRALEARMSSTEVNQQALLDAADKMEASFESGLAGMLTRIEDTEEKVAADAAAAAEAEAKAKGASGWAAVRRKSASRANTAQQFRDTVTTGLKEAAEKRKQGQLFKGWTEMMERRLVALERQVEGLGERTADEEAIAQRGAQLAAEAMRRELAEQVALAVERSTYASKKETKARIEAQDSHLRTATERSETLAAEMQDSFVRVRADTSRALTDAHEAYIRAQDASKSSAEMHHMSQRLAEMNAEVVKLRMGKADKEAMDEFRTVLWSETKERLETLETRVITESNERLSAAREHVDERFNAELAESTRAAREQTMESRLSLVDSRLARKLDAAQEYSRIQQTVVEGSNTSMRLRDIKQAMAHLLELVLRIEASPSRSPSPQQEPGSHSREFEQTKMQGRVLPAAATRPAPMHARPASIGSHAEATLLAHSGAGVVSTFVGSQGHREPTRPHYATEHKRTVDSTRRPASAGSMRRADTAPVTHPWQVKARPGSASTGLAPRFSTGRPTASCAPGNDSSASSRLGSPEGRARQLLLEDSALADEELLEQDAQWAAKSKRLQLAGV